MMDYDPNEDYDLDEFDDGDCTQGEFEAYRYAAGIY